MTQTNTQTGFIWVSDGRKQHCPKVADFLTVHTKYQYQSPKHQMNTNTMEFYLFTLVSQIAPIDRACSIELDELRIVLSRILTTHEKDELKKLLQIRIDYLREIGGFQPSACVDLALQASTEVQEHSERSKNEIIENFGKNHAPMAKVTENFIR